MLPNTLKKVVEASEADGTPVKLAVLMPSARAKSDAKLYSLRKFNEAVTAKVMVEKQLERHVRDMGLWTDEDQAERERLVRAIVEGERQIKGGNINKCRAAAIQLGKDRAALHSLTSVFSDLKNKTAESLAEQDYFNHLVASCTVYDEGRFEGSPYFTRDGKHPSVDVYVERGSEPVAYQAAVALHEAMNGSVRDALSELPENAFLRRFKFIDADFNFIDRDGNLVDEDGRRIDAEGYLLDAAGRRVDREGNPLDENGEPVGDAEPFTDDEGNVIEPPEAG